jgi:hypothetical protein
MRRSLLAGIGALAVFIFVACSTDQPSREPLAPTVPSLVQGQSCSNQLASNISKAQKDLFTGAALTAIETAFDNVKAVCPVTAGNAVLQSYIETLITYSQAPTNAARAGALVSLLSSVTQYATGTSITGLSATNFQTQGGAAVLSPGESMTTWDGRARLEIQNGTTPGGSHLWTFEPRATSECDGTTSLRITGNCYQVHDYPDETVAYSPPFIITLCLHSLAGATGIGHEAAAFSGKAEVLQETTVATFLCEHTESAMNSWLGREAGPLGRAVARAYDYLRPRPLFADDAGESGLGLFTSLFGGVLNDIFADNFDDPADFNDGVDTPDLGDAWTIQTSSPGFIQQQPALGDLSGGIVVLSQAQGNCANCPQFRLLGTRVNSSQSETVGSYDVSWTSLQNKPNIKEAPFVILNSNANNNEIARLSYVSVSNQNRLLLKVPGNGNSVTTIDVGAWVQNVHQDFTITVNLNVLNDALDNTVSLSIGGVPVANAQNIAAPRATSLKQIGYVLTGIDAGIIGSDNWLVTRKADLPPSP